MFLLCASEFFATGPEEQKETWIFQMELERKKIGAAIYLFFHRHKTDVGRISGCEQSILQTGFAEPIIIIPTTGEFIYHIADKNMNFPLTVCSLTLFYCLSPICLFFINDVYVSLADSYPRERITLSFWCSINHKQRQMKDVYSVSEEGWGTSEGNQADIMSHSVWIQLKNEHELIKGEKKVSVWLKQRYHLLKK